MDADDRFNLIGEFLACKRRQTSRDGYRELVHRSPRRRNLTQEDVASLLDRSAVLVSQVENGRYANLSRSLINDFADALRCLPIERAYLLGLLEPTPEQVVRKDVPPVARTLCDKLDPIPAFITNPLLDLLYWNASFARLIFDPSLVPEPLRNVATSQIEMPEVRSRWRDMDENAALLAAGYRFFVGVYPEVREPVLAMVERLRQASPLFDAGWTSQALADTPLFNVTLVHPELGELHLEQVGSHLAGIPGLFVIQLFPRDDATRRRIEAFLASPINRELPDRP